MLLWLAGRAQYDFGDIEGVLKKNQKQLGGAAVVLVYKDSQTIYKKESMDFSARVQMPLGDCSEWLTAALVMTFVDQGQISLDDPVGKYLPIFNSYLKRYVTIRHCLSHTTGIENNKGILSKISQPKIYATLEEMVNAYAGKEISNNPGVEFSYGYIGPAIAARVLEVVGKKSFERLLSDRILHPLKMRQTSFFSDNGDAPNPSTGGIATPNDYMNFLVMILHKGVFEGKRILSEAAITEMQKSQFATLPVKYTPKAMEGSAYGLGEWIEEKDAAGNAVLVSCSGPGGPWAWIDKCRNYAALIFVRKPQSDPKKGVYTQVKAVIADKVQNNCR